MRNNIAILLAASLFLSGCNRQLTPVQTQYKVVEPEAAYYVCNKVPLPDPENLTDVQLAALVNELVKENRVCHNNMAAIKQFLENAKKILEEKK